MNKHFLLSCLGLLLGFAAFSQISFSNQTAVYLSDTTVYSGVAMGIADMNGDSLDDIIRLKNARTLRIEYQQEPDSTFENYVYGNMGNGSQWGICIADVDTNGYNDIITGGAYNKLKLLKANDTGDAYSLTNITNPSIFLQGINFADIDNNGTVDIFACHDDGLSAPFSNDGEGNFTHDISLIDASSTVPSDNSGNYGSVWTDYDNDGDLDMYLSKCRLGVSNPNDGRRLNLLFQNDGNNNYTDVAPAAGLQPMAQSWAADFGDVDNDGDLDCFLINHDMVSQIYENNGDGTFTDVTAGSGMSADLNDVGGGIQCIFEDFDNDGFLDLLYTSLSGDHLLFQNDGDFTFTKVTDPFPTNLGIHSAVTGDLNNDGYLDVYAGFAVGYNGPNINRPDKLFINEESGNNYFKLLLKGDSCNINAIGAKAEIYGDWGVQVREVRSGESYGIMNSLALHFGLGDASQIDSLLIKWPNGHTEKLCGVDSNQMMVLTENALPQLLHSQFTYVENGLELSLTNTSEGIPGNFYWDFGDGTTSTEENPVHTFPGTGPYTISLAIENDCETDTFSLEWSTGPLPLELLSFSAEKIAERQVALKWITENEEAFSHFELERSVDLPATEIIATIPGRNTSSVNHYEWIDRFPKPGDNYYRLKHIDIDGSFKFTDWAHVPVHIPDVPIQVYPNPTTGELHVITKSESVESLRVYDLNGKLELQQYELPGSFKLDLSGLRSGLYILRIQSNQVNRFTMINKIKL